MGEWDIEIMSRSSLRYLVPFRSNFLLLPRQQIAPKGGINVMSIDTGKNDFLLLDVYFIFPFTPQNARKY